MNPYLLLTKPRISLLFAFTGLAVLLLHSTDLNAARILLITLSIFLIGGAANALNQYFERDRDRLMARTAKKRPLPQGLISPAQALSFSLAIGLIGTGILWKWGSPLALVFGLGTIVFYSFYYTLYLKPRTPYNIVIGGVPGAMGPLIAAAAVTGSVQWAPFVMFLIIFFWTPPHFWALALCCKDDYAKVGLPMLPLIVGDAATRRQILYYSLIMPFLCFLLFWMKAYGWIYLISALFLNLGFVGGAIYLSLKKTIRSYWMFFAFSIVYMLLLFAAMVVDHATSSV